jgi:hypothetical protein
MTIFCCCCCLLIKAEHGKNENKNTGLFINCMDFVAVRTKINKKKSSFFFVMLGLWMTHNTYTWRKSHQIPSKSEEFGTNER